MSEIPVHPHPRRLADWINPMGAKKVHSLIDKVYQRKNLEMAWDRVRANRGSGGVDGQCVGQFAEQVDQQLDRLQLELVQQTYQPQPVRRVSIPKIGKPGENRMLGIPSIYDRVCQQALLNRLEPIFEPVFDEANFGYRRGRSTHDAMRKVWKEIKSGREWVVDADLKDFFDTIPQTMLMNRIEEKISDGRVLRLIEEFMHQRVLDGMKEWSPDRGTPQGVIISPLFSNIYLHPLDKRMEVEGIEMIRYADDMVVLCRTKTKRTNGKSLTEIISKVNRTLKGWFEYFKHSIRTTFLPIDRWLRMRLRSILRKRKGGKGRGRGSDHQRWPNAFFIGQGLFFLKEAPAQACQSRT